MAAPAIKLLMAASGAGAGGDPFENLVSSLNPTHWHKANDASGALANYGSGSGTASATGTPDYSQTIGSFTGVNLDGSTEYFQSSGTLGAGNFSMFMIWQPDTMPGSGNLFTLMHTGPNTGNMFERGLLLLANNAGTMYAMVALTGGTRQDVTSASGLYTSGNMYTVGVNYNGSTIKMYLDGSEVASASYSGGADHTGGMRIGYENGGDSLATVRHFDGKFAHVIWWNTPISATDQADLAAAAGV